MSRRLTAEDRDLWARVSRSVIPLRPAQAIPMASAPPPREPVVADRAAPEVVTFRVGQAADAGRRNDVLPGLAESLAAMPLRMDAGVFGKMRRGKLRPEARLDLHGMTLAEAYPALDAFIRRSRARGLRLVLVITGKGRVIDEAPMPVRAGRLRSDVPRWLALQPLAGMVQQVVQAHRRHGGEGALYVYLRAG